MTDIMDSQADRDRAARAAHLLEEEVTRRKRILRFYLAALLVPVGIGVYVLATGKRDGAEHLADHGRLDSLEATVEQVQPALSRLNTLDTTILVGATAVIERQDRRVRELQARQNELERHVTRVLTTAARPDTAPRVSPSPVDEPMRAALQSVRVQVANQERVIAAQRAQISRQESQIQALQRDQDSIRAVVRRIPRAQLTPQLTPDLLDRLTRLERSTDSLRRTFRRPAQGGVRPPGV